MFISFSAVDRSSAAAYIKLALSFVMAYEFEYNADYLRKTNVWRKNAQGFIDRFKIPVSVLDKAHALMLQSASPEENTRYDHLIDRIVQDLAKRIPAFKKELDLRKEDISFLNDIRLLHEKGSEPAFRRISKNVSFLGDTDINAMFVEDHGETSTEQQELENLVEKHSGTPGLVMPLSVVQDWQKTAKQAGEKLDDHARYLELRRTINTAFKTRLQSIVRSSGKKMLPFRDVVEQLEQEQVSHTLPDNFVGMIDDAGNLYTTAGKQLQQKPSGEVRMNPAYDAQQDNTFVCTFKPFGANEFARAYTVDFRAAKQAKKYNVVTSVVPHLAKYARKWRTDMKRKDRTGMLATLVEFVYLTSARVGNARASSYGQQTFGATQLRARHFTIDSSKIVVVYSGKSGGKQRHVIPYTQSNNTRLLHANLTRYLEDKQKDDSVFVYNNKVITGAMLNKYLRSLGFPEGFSIHKLRTARGTKMASDILAKSPFKRNGDWKERDVNKWVEQELLAIAKELGHRSNEKFTINTAVQNYIAPEILSDFYSKLGIRPPAKIQKAIDQVKA